MGMYTELVMAVKLKKDAPKLVVGVLRYMCGEADKDEALRGYAQKPPAHPFFETGWEYVLRCDSYYFHGDTHSTVRFDDIANSWYLTVRTNLKNYSSEIEHFLLWIAPYADTVGFVGYMRYEEAENPTLIYFTETGSPVFAACIPPY
jgi:hypothetical protein